jgi:molecular chaperone HtpG
MTEVNQKTKQFEFKAETKQLLNILVHSLYTHKEIFLRELISNASDALDKIRFEITKGTDVAQKELPLEINIDFDDKKNTITVSDTGIGMTEAELISNIGTIAKSGSADFIKRISESGAEATNIIGKFGVGFYSVFMVADKVEVITKSYKHDSKSLKWISDGLGTYEIIELENKTNRGTEIIIYLREDQKEFAEKYRLEQIIKKHSNFISFPIKVKNEQVNSIQAIWREPKSALTKEKYNEFYKFLTFDSEEPLEVIHKSIDAPIQFHCLLFIPSKSNEFFFYNREDYGLDLYVRRVLIQHKTKELLPEYLSFVRGIVDSEDLPLNISRETLQEDIVFNKITSNVTSQILNSLTTMAKDDVEKYNRFWTEHAKVFKMGYMDFANHDKYTELLRFNSSGCQSEKELISFEQYISKISAEQKEIYYMVGSNREAILNDPHYEIFNRKGLEVLFLYDPIDEFVLSSIRKYKEYELKSIDQADLSKVEKLEDKNEKPKIESLEKDDELHFKSLMSKMKDIIGDRVTEVRESKRLTDSPACLINADAGMSASMQKILGMMNKDNSIPKHIFEINKNHKLIRNLIKVFKKNSNDDFIKEITEQLYESSLLLEGYLSDTHKLVSKMNSLMEDSSEWYVTVKKI